MNGKTVAENERLAGLQVRFEIIFIQLALQFVGDQDLDDVGLLRHFRGGDGLKSMFHGQIVIGPSRALADQDLHPAVTQILRLGVSLAAVSDNAHRLALEQPQVGILIVVKLWHGRPFRHG